MNTKCLPCRSSRLFYIPILICVLALNLGSFSGITANAASPFPIIATIQLGSRPFAVAVNESTNRIYVTHYETNTVSVIDGNTNTVIASIPVIAAPNAIGINTLTNKIYVSNGNYGSPLSVIDGNTNTVITNIPVDINTRSIAVNQNTNQIYVTVNTGPTFGPYIDIIDGSVDAVTSKILGTAIATGAISVAVNPTNNKLFVADGNALVRIIDANTDTYIPNLQTGDLVLNLPTNRLYMLGGTNSLTTIDGVNNAVLNTLSVPLFNNADGVYAIDVNPSTNHVFITHSLGGISVLDGATDAFLADLIPISGTTGVAANSVTNRVYITISTDNTLAVIDDSPASPTPTPTPLPQAQDVQIDPQLSDEPSIAVDPGNPQHLVVGYNLHLSNGVACGWAESFDGGKTWLPENKGNINFPLKFLAAGDPWVRYGPDGTLFYSCMANTRDMQIQNAKLKGRVNGVFVAASSTGSARDFGVANTITNVFCTLSKGNCIGGQSIDRPSIGVLRTSEGSNLLVACWGSIIFGQTTGHYINVSTSTDDGVTWSTPISMGGPSASNCTIGGGNSRVAVSWWEAANIDNSLKLRISVDGVQWDNVVTLSSVGDLVAVDTEGTLASTTDKVLSAPYALVVSKDNGALRAFYQIRVGGRSEVFVADSDNSWIGIPLDRSLQTESFLPGAGTCSNMFGVYLGLPGKDTVFSYTVFSYTVWSLTLDRQFRFLYQSKVPLKGKNGYLDSRYTLRRIGDYTGVECGGSSVVAAWTDTRNKKVQIWGQNVSVPR